MSKVSIVPSCTSVRLSAAGTVADCRYESQPVHPGDAVNMPVQAGGRRDRKKDETRQALREAAHRLFAEKGFSRTTIDDIAEAADVSRRTFFRYYDSKDDLLRTDVADLLPVMLAALRRRPVEELPLAAILNALRTLIGPDGPPALAREPGKPGRRAARPDQPDPPARRLGAGHRRHASHPGRHRLADRLRPAPRDRHRLRRHLRAARVRPDIPRPATTAPAWRPAASFPSSSRRSPCCSIRAPRRGGRAGTPRTRLSRGGIGRETAYGSGCGGGC